MSPVVGGLTPTQVLGVSLILGVSVIWVASSFLVQGVEAAGVSPLLLTYVANSLFAICWPVALLVKRARDGLREEGRGDAPPSTDVTRGDGSGGGSGGRGSGTGAADPDLRATTPLAHILRAAAVVAPLWFGAQLIFNASLALTSVTSNTILSSSASLWTYLLSVLAGRERFTSRKLALVLSIILGTALVTLADGDDAGGRGGGGNAGGAPPPLPLSPLGSSAGEPSPPSPSSAVLGDVLCVLSAVLYGAYTLAIRLMLASDDAADTAAFFGAMGTGIAVIGGLGLGLASLLGLIVLRATGRGLALAVVKGLFDNVLSDFLWARSILLIGPTLATAGLALQVPLAVTADGIFGSPSWLRGAGPALLTALGAIFVVGGFLALLREEKDDGAALPAAADGGVEASRRAGLGPSSSPSEAAAALEPLGSSFSVEEGRVDDAGEAQRLLGSAGGG